MQGIPKYDKHKTAIENATEEAEVRNAVKAFNADGSLTVGQKLSLGQAASDKIGALAGQTSIIAGNGGGEVVRDASLPPAARSASPLPITPEEVESDG